MLSLQMHVHSPMDILSGCHDRYDGSLDVTIDMPSMLLQYMEVDGRPGEKAMSYPTSEN